MESLTSNKPETDDSILKLRGTATVYKSAGQSLIVIPALSQVERLIVRLKRTGAPSGTIWAVLYNEDLSATLATSDTVDVSTISDAAVEDVIFDFPSPAIMSTLGYSFIGIHTDYANSTTDYIEIFGDVDSGPHEGAAYRQNLADTWSSLANYDLWFDVQGTMGITIEGQESGLFGAAVAISGDERGMFGVAVTILGSESGLFGVARSYEQPLSGHFRVANDALALYELYVGVDGDPDLTAAPLETFSTLPHTTTATFGPGHFYRWIVRRRNQYNLSSQNVYGPNNANIGGGTFTVNVDGSVAATPPSAPEDISITASSGGTMLVTANYQYLPDGANAATRFLVWLTSNGVDPNPADAPVVVPFYKSDGIGKLRYTTGAYAAGLTIKALVRVRRIDAGPVNVDSTNTAIVSDVSETAGPSAASAVAIIDEKEQVQ